MNHLRLMTPAQDSTSPASHPRLRSLESRLEDGYARIEQARTAGEDVSAWEDFWIDLLRQYEDSMTDLVDAA